MPWLSLRVEVERAAADALSEALLEAGAQSVDIQDPDGPATAVNALFAEDADPAGALARAVTASGAAIRSPSPVTRVHDQDWVRLSQGQFAALRIGRLWIGATWHTPPGDAQAIVRIDPGLAFGTGSHPSTRLVLSFLERVIKGGEELLDYGCGSGILAIAAAKLGAARVDAVDIDTQAVEVARANARANSVELRPLLPEALGPGRYHLVVANILAQPIIALAAGLAARTRAGGRIALAGILDTQATEVMAAYAAHFDINIAERDAAWVLLEGVRR